MQRTIRIQLHPSPRQADALAETSRQFTSAFNLFVEMGWRDGVSNATKLHFLAYYPVRIALPDLNSNLTNTARAKAAEALKSAFTLRKDQNRKDVDHVLSKQIIAAAEPGGTIVLENLKNMRKRMRAKRRMQTKRRMHAWPFAGLTAKIAYKAEERGCTVVAVDPRHTSQMCSCCGHTARNNRRSQSIFICRQCGYQLNADLNGARNIAAKYHASGGRSSAGGLRNQPIVSAPTPLASGRGTSLGALALGC